MTPGELILGICPDCAYLHFEQPFPEVCPGCGTAKSPMSPEVAAERHAQSKAGKPLNPIVVRPDKNTPGYQRFYDGVQMLRAFLEDEVETLHAIEAELAKGPSVPEGPDKIRLRKLELEKDGVEARCHQLSEINRLISELVFAEGQNQRGSHRRTWAERGRPTVRREGDPCPRKYDQPNKWCPGNLWARPGGDPRQDPRQLECDRCGMCWDNPIYVLGQPHRRAGSKISSAAQERASFFWDDTTPPNFYWEEDPDATG